MITTNSLLKISPCGTSYKSSPAFSKKVKSGMDYSEINPSQNFTRSLRTRKMSTDHMASNHFNHSNETGILPRHEVNELLENNNQIKKDDEKPDKEVIQQIVRHLSDHQAAGPGPHNILRDFTIDLQSEHFGSVHINVQSKGNNFRAHFSIDNPATLKMLEENLVLLKDSLSGADFQGISITDITFSLNDKNHNQKQETDLALSFKKIMPRGSNYMKNNNQHKVAEFSGTTGDHSPIDLEPEHLGSSLHISSKHEGNIPKINFTADPAALPADEFSFIHHQKQKGGKRRFEKEHLTIINKENSETSSFTQKQAERNSFIDSKLDEKNLLSQFPKTMVEFHNPSHKRKAFFADHSGPVEHAGQVIPKEKAGLEIPLTKIPLSPEELIQQTSPQISAHIKNNGQNLIIDLQPEYLGKLHISLEMKENMLKANIMTENPVVQKMLEENLALLKASLANQGVQVEHFSVSVGEKGNDQDRGDTFAKYSKKRDQKIKSIDIASPKALSEPNQMGSQNENNEINYLA